MKTMKSMYIALFGAFLLVAGSATVWAQAAQQTGDQNQSDSSAAKKGKKNKKADADTAVSKAASDSGTASSKKRSTSKKADAADKSATADSSTAPKNRNNTRKIKNGYASGHSGCLHRSGQQARRRTCRCDSREHARRQDAHHSASASGKQRWHGLGEYGLRRVSQTGNSLVRKNQAGEVHDGSRCRQGRL